MAIANTHMEKHPSVLSSKTRQRPCTWKQHSLLSRQVKIRGSDTLSTAAGGANRYDLPEDWFTNNSRELKDIYIFGPKHYLLE